MISDDIFKEAITAIAEQIGTNVGNLLVLSTLQTKALLILADAIKNDPGVSSNTREQANSAIKTVDLMIESLEKMAGQDATSVLKDIIGSNNERG